MAVHAVPTKDNMSRVDIDARDVMTLGNIGRAAARNIPESALDLEHDAADYPPISLEQAMAMTDEEADEVERKYASWCKDMPYAQSLYSIRDSTLDLLQNRETAKKPSAMSRGKFPSTLPARRLPNRAAGRSFLAVSKMIGAQLTKLLLNILFLGVTLYPAAASISILALSKRAQDEFPDYSGHNMIHNILAVSATGTATAFLGGVIREAAIFNLILGPLLTGLSVGQLKSHGGELAIPSNEQLHEVIKIISIIAAVDIGVVWGGLFFGIIYLACV